MIARIRRTLRVLVCLLVVLGLVPGASELVENLEHVLHDGHLRHSEAHDVATLDEHCGAESDEHGCTPLAHDCGCCVSIPGLPDVPRPELGAPLLAVAVDHLGAVSDRGPPSRDIAPLHRPPIA